MRTVERKKKARDVSLALESCTLDTALVSLSLSQAAGREKGEELGGFLLITGNLTYSLNSKLSVFLHSARGRDRGREKTVAALQPPTSNEGKARTWVF